MFDYKKIIKNRKTRLAILRALCFVPDKIMLFFQYYLQLGRFPNFNNPKRYSEKIQVYKMRYRNKLMIECVDKYDVRDYVKKKGLGSILNETYGVFDNPKEIVFDNLPNSFVIKDTLGGGGNSVIVVRDKNKLDIPAITAQMCEWVTTNSRVRDAGREWPYYSGKKHRIIIEKYIEPEDSEAGLVDYKFFCFNGVAEYIYIMSNRRIGEAAETGIFDRSFNRMKVKRCGSPILENAIIPANYHELLETAEKLSEGFPHVRVDLYNEHQKILFGEMTFFGASGYVSFDPDDFDFELGSKFTM